MRPGRAGRPASARPGAASPRSGTHRPALIGGQGGAVAELGHARVHVAEQLAPVVLGQAAPGAVRLPGGNGIGRAQLLDLAGPADLLGRGLAALLARPPFPLRRVEQGRVHLPAGGLQVPGPELLERGRPGLGDFAHLGSASFGYVCHLLEPSPPTGLRLHPRGLRKPCAPWLVTCAGHGWATLVGDARSGPLPRRQARGEGAGRQPGRDRRARAARLPRARPGGGGRLLRRRPRRPPRRGGRRGLAHRRGHPGQELPEHRRPDRRGPAGPGRRRPSRLRVPGRERRLRPGGDGRRAALGRAQAGRHRHHGRQGGRPPGGRAGQGAAGPGHGRAAGRTGGGGGLRRPPRLPAGPQGGLRRRRPGHEGGPLGRGGGRRAGVGPARVQGRLRPRRDLRRALPGRPPPRRGPGPGDGRGEVVFLGERDCSLQRRHQKLVEEAPAPGLPEEVRVALGKAACDIARAAEYENAGTIEFLYEPATQKFYFLEMNTRLQVEHPVTELTAGIDLVHAQLRVAAGEGIPAHYDAVAARGHAIEVRINAEDPGKNFTPAPGPITGWREPSGPGVRVDAGVRAGFTVPQAYDSLLAKLIVWGEDRDQARRRMLRALDEFQIEGVPTTIPFHRLAMTDPAFVAGDVSTVLVEQGMDLSSLEPAVLDGAGPPTAKPPPRRLVIELEGKRFDVDMFPQEPVKVPERIRTPRSPKALERARAESGGPGKEVVKTPMQGTIVKVLVAEGDTVKAGQTLVVLEAMKMENHVTAHQAGTVAGLEVTEGQTVPTGATIAIIEAA